MVIKNLWRRKTRTLLTVLGIAVGVAAVVALSAFGEGMADGFQGIMSVNSADLMVGQKDALMMLYSSVDESLGDELRQLDGVAAVAGAVVGFVQMTDAPYFVVMGEDPRGFAIGRYTLTAGGPLTGHYQILLGQIAAKNFKKTLGDTFRLNGVSYRVVGIYNTGVSLEDGGAVILLEDAQRAFTTRDKVTYFSLQAQTPGQITALKTAIETRWPQLAATRTGEATRQDEFLNIYRGFGLVVGVFAALIGGLGMMNTMLMSVLERTREIGVLRALGWRRRRVLKLILSEALVLALLGGLLGIGLGLGLIRLAQWVPAVESLLQDTVTPNMLLQAAAIAVLLGLVGGLYPTWRATQLTPLEAMRAEGGGTAGAAGARWLPAFARNLGRRPARTLATVAGLGLGVGFVVAIVALTDGVQVKFTQLTTAGQMDLVAEQANASDISFSEIDDRVATRLRAEPGVRSVSRILLAFPSTADMPFFFLFGLDPQEDYIHHYRIREGRLPQRTEEIALGRFGANSLKKTVGDTVHLSNTTFHVVGIYENGSSYEDTGGLILLKDAQRMLNKPRKVTLLGIQAVDPAQAKALAQRLEAQYPELMVVEAQGFTQRAQDFQTMNAIWAVLIAVTLVVGGIVMTNTMLMSVFERTQEIGVLRALGWRRRRILGLVVGEALALSVVSALAGSALGVGLNTLTALIPVYGDFITPAYSPELFIRVALLTVGLGVLGGVYPAWRAANLRPIEALRYE